MDTGKERKEVDREKGISIRKLNYMMAGVTILVSIVLLFVSYQTWVSYRELESTTERYLSGQEAAKSMQASSDYLTEQVRCFTVTGDRQYLDNYFHESETSKRREEALHQLSEDFDGTEIYEDLETALNESVALMQTEYYAMRLTVESKGYDRNIFPEQVRDYPLSEADRLLSAWAKKEKAIDLVFNEQYRKQKERISTGTAGCLNRLLQKIRLTEELTNDRFSRIITVERVLVIFLIVIVLVIVLLTAIQVIGPLIRAIPKIREDKPIPVSGASEFRFLANTYNKMYEDNRGHREKLAYEACHDQLTGAYNRVEFSKILWEEEFESAALLLIDIDRFKSINDSYGHVVGDKVLSRVTDEVTEHFRDSDPLCRIGGDEFVLFMDHVGPESKDLISEKVSHINAALMCRAPHW